MLKRFLQDTHLSIGLRLLFTIALTEAIIMLIFKLTHIEEQMSSIAIVLVDTLVLSIMTSIVTYYWVINPMKSLKIQII